MSLEESIAVPPDGIFRVCILHGGRVSECGVNEGIQQITGKRPLTLYSIDFELP